MTATLPLPEAPTSPERTGHVPWWRGALAGLLAAAAALAVGELLAGLLRGASTSVVSVGQVVVENVPNSVKEFAIRTFGENDKNALILGTSIILFVISIALGIAATRRLWIGVAGTLVLGAVGTWSALTRPGAGLSAAWPSVLGSLVGVLVMVWLIRGSLADLVPGPDTEDRPAPAPSGFDRRRFLVSAAVVGAGAAVIGGTGRALQRRFDVGAARNALELPPPSSPAAALPAGTDLGVSGITPFVTANRDFYRVDTALVVPQVSPSGWKLKIGGMVDNPLELSFDDLVNRELIERDITMVCVSNEVGGTLAGTARWLGVPLKPLLEEAGVQAGADQLVSRSVDSWTAGTPTALLTDGRDAMIAIGMNGEPLPVEHGFPARLVVPGLYGYTSATKWLTEMELTTFDAYDAYWVQRGWAQVAPIKTLTRIDTPRGLGKASAGSVPVGGVAWAIHRGIESVQVQVDDGPWEDARLGTVPDADTWVQWVYDWDATPGRHTLTARSTDSSGEVQTEDRAKPIPDGASGWHSIVVIVS